LQFFSLQYVLKLQHIINNALISEGKLMWAVTLTVVTEKNNRPRFLEVVYSKHLGVVTLNCLLRATNWESWTLYQLASFL